ncbi:TIGR04063 family PEP-CTERM/XrtA system glycosyltransferase [Rheinheimera sp. 4Y26]|uniref:TIGR04063 family PEP-CTERM/XrtA system glycosyltransferase n=1 Tax=Rheinheimera sp. 4Y26 TaxID=2977811 RepID=UPI0021B14C21|nr:TIGR04063 family PEP-CTERM/XrtA system glycosyltransferase [Rheinheimera sp. 4Y26]MCT6699028.1 glycosyltransferase, exosortase A system-associated [Rheinheimera sp. 4Y26]
MKILHLFDHSIPLHSGYTFRSRAILQQQANMGFQTCHVTSPKQGACQQAKETVDGLTFYRTEAPDGFLSKIPVLNQLILIPAMKKRLLEVIALEKPDVIHAHSPALNGMAALLAGKAAGIPVVYEVRAFWEDAAVDHGTCKEGDLRYRLTKAMETYVLKGADAVTTICEGLRKDMLSRGIAADKITPIPNAVNVEQFQLINQKDQQLAEKLGLQGKKVLGFLGSFYAYEGLDLLVAAMPAILKQVPDAVLLLVGGGPQQQALEQQIRELGLEQHVIMPGRVPHSVVNSYYSLVDLLVYPRKSMRLTELVTPLKPLEAMAQGKVLLASNVGGHHELIEHGKTGWLFQSDDVTALSNAAVELLNATEQWPQIRQNGRNFVENVRNWQQSCSPYLNIYQRLCHAK